MDTSGSASFHSAKQGPEPESELVDEALFHPKPEPNTETQLPIEEHEFEPVITMAPTTVTATTMDVDHEGKSYLKKPGPREINKMIQALTTKERNEMFNLAERDDEEKGPKEQDFSQGELSRRQSLLP